MGSDLDYLTGRSGLRARTRLRRVGVLASVVALVLLMLAPGAEAAVSPWVFAAQLASAQVPPARVFDAGAGGVDGRSGVFYGGQAPNPGVPFADTWVNLPSGWTPKCGTNVAGATQACGPGSRTALGMATGPNGVLLYGGFAGALGNVAPSGDMWQWNGASWTQVCTTLTCGPGDRALLAMAGNGVKAVLYGGLGTGNALADDTWVYDGTAWTQTCGGTLPTACGPGSLAGASMAWDGTQFVLFGGTTNVGGVPPIADTWTFNGATWAKACGSAPAGPCGPPGRVFGAFAYAHDNPGGISGAILAEGGDLFGNPTTTLYRDAWLWHAGAWTELSVPWSGSPITFPGNDGNPPPGADPLLGVLTAEPATCSLVYLGTQPAGTVAALIFNSVTFTGGRNRTGSGAVNGCTAPPAPVTSTPSTVHPTSTVSAVSTASPEPILAATGSRHAGTLAAVAIVLIAVGATTTALARRPG